MIRKDRSSRSATGSAYGGVNELRIGERVPDTIEVESFPEGDYRKVPTVREYRYITRENRTYLIEPRARVVIEEID